MNSFSITACNLKVLFNLIDPVTPKKCEIPNLQFMKFIIRKICEEDAFDKRIAIIP
jgi:hypothetical protein